MTPAGLAALGLLIVSSAFCILFGGPRGQAEGATLERMRHEGVARIGIANEEPYGWLDTATGEVTGEAPEIARVIFRRLGIERLDAVTTGFGSLIPGLKAGRFDVIAAGMYITPERCREVAFSHPTYRIGEAFVVRAGNPRDLHSYGDVAQDDDATLGVVAGTVEVGYAHQTGVPDDRVVILNDNASALEAVRTGQVDAFAGTSLTVDQLLAKSGAGDLEHARPFEQPVIDGEPVWGYGAFGFRPEDDRLRNAFDHELDRFIGTPQHLELVRPFGFTEEDLPGDVSVAELCTPKEDR